MSNSNYQSLESNMDSNDDYLIPSDIYDELVLCAHCIKDEMRNEIHTEFSLVTIDTALYIKDIVLSINNIFNGKPYDTNDVFITSNNTMVIAKNIFYIIMYTNIEKKELQLYLNNIFKEYYAERLLYLISPILDRFKNNTADEVGFDFYTLDIFKVKDNMVDLKVMSI